MTNTIQKKYKVSSTQLLYQSSPYQAATLLISGPFLDNLLTNQNVFAFKYTTQVVVRSKICISVHTSFQLTFYLCNYIFDKHLLFCRFSSFFPVWFLCPLISVLSLWLERHPLSHIKCWDIWKHALFWHLATSCFMIHLAGGTLWEFWLPWWAWLFTPTTVPEKVRRRLLKRHR